MKPKCKDCGESYEEGSVHACTESYKIEKRTVFDVVLYYGEKRKWVMDDRNTEEEAKQLKRKLEGDTI